MVEKTKGWIQPGISVGNLLVLATMLVTLTAAWGRMEMGLADHDKRIVVLEESEKALTAERMKEVRDMADLRADMRWIRATLERLERELKARE